MNKMNPYLQVLFMFYTHIYYRDRHSFNCRYISRWIFEKFCTWIQLYTYFFLKYFRSKYQNFYLGKKKTHVADFSGFANMLCYEYEHACSVLESFRIWGTSNGKLAGNVVL